MVTVKEMPAEGQFIAMWRFEGKVWADTWKIYEGRILYLSDDEWLTLNYLQSFMEKVSSLVFVVSLEEPIFKESLRG